MATDLAINDMLVQNGMDRPDGAQYRKRFEGMYAEEIYAELKDDILREDEDLEYETDDANDVQKNDKNDSDEEQSPQSNESEKIRQDDFLQEQLFEEFSKSVLENEKRVDELPNGLERFFDLEKYGKIDWRNELKVSIDRFHKDDYTLVPPNKKFLHMGFYIP